MCGPVFGFFMVQFNLYLDTPLSHCFLFLQAGPGLSLVVCFPAATAESGRRSWLAWCRTRRGRGLESAGEFLTRFASARPKEILARMGVRCPGVAVGVAAGHVHRWQSDVDLIGSIGKSSLALRLFCGCSVVSIRFTRARAMSSPGLFCVVPPPPPDV